MTLIQKTIRKKAKSLAGTIKKNKGLKAGERKQQAARVLIKAEKDIANLEIKRTGNETGNGIKPGSVCMICGDRVGSRSLVVILGYEKNQSSTGELIPFVRHSICYPGSSRWLASAIGQESAYRKYFGEPVKEVLL